MFRPPQLSDSRAFSPASQARPCSGLRAGRSRCHGGLRSGGGPPRAARCSHSASRPRLAPGATLARRVILQPSVTSWLRGVCASTLALAPPTRPRLVHLTRAPSRSDCGRTGPSSNCSLPHHRASSPARPVRAAWRPTCLSRRHARRALPRTGRRTLSLPQTSSRTGPASRNPPNSPSAPPTPKAATASPLAPLRPPPALAAKNFRRSSADLSITRGPVRPTGERVRGDGPDDPGRRAP